ncbi:hypothetical protein BD770DRAFT_401251 [Pilaira anomala]|nr:hypothetical protein BD770DRAFT_401251 [Pilaira anomala]
MYSSSSSVPDENINFDLVYALHTFVATVDGQASVVKGDAMTLLDDTNSYWWLIRALKASEVGYIPAENIETPFERLARLNKHRNVQVTSLDQLQHYGNSANKSSSTRKTKLKKKVKVSKELACQLQIILTDAEDHTVYEEVFEKWDEPMSSIAYRGCDINTQEEEEEEEDIVDSEAEEEDSNSNTNKTKKSTINMTPLLNPNFNKPINITETKPVSLDKPLPLIQLEEQPKPSITAAPTSAAVTVVKKVTGLKRLLSIGSSSNGNTKKKLDSPQSPVSIEKEKNDQQYHVLRIFSGNINVGAMFNSVAVTPEMNADQLLKLALQKFHIPLLEESASKRPTSGIEYYLTVKSMDGDEITLEPTDKPLAIFESLSDHLTTPMPSLTYIKRLSIEQPTIKVTRVGVSKARQRAKARFGEDSVIRFSLHKRIRRTIDTAPGQIYVKISFHAENHNKQISTTSSTGNKISTMGLIRKSSLLRVDQQIQQQQQLQQQQQQLLQNAATQERIDKLVAISTTTSILELTHTALDKFHMANEDKSEYTMTLSLNGQETSLVETKTISEILNDSDLIPKGTVEKLFVLRKKHSALPIVPPLPTTSLSESTSESTNRFVRYILKQQDHKESHVPPETMVESNTVSSTGNVLKRLDQAILSLENDKRQLDRFKYNGPSSLSRNYSDHTTPTLSNRILPVRSNSLSVMSDYRSNQKMAPIRSTTQDMNRKFPPTRSSSLKISGDVFDNTETRTSISNMDDLEMELQRIASSH